MLGRRYLERADTLVEVLLAVTVFSMVAASALLIMNQSVNAAQRAVEITLVRQQIDAQAEALRAVHQAASKKADPDAGTVWATVTGTTPSYEEDACPARRSALPAGTFALNTRTAEVLTGDWYGRAGSGTAEQPPYAQVVSTDPDNPSALQKSYGIWVESQADGLTDSTPGVYTFRIRACWDAVGLNAPQRIETIVRLYEL